MRNDVFYGTRMTEPIADISMTKSSRCASIFNLDTRENSDVLCFLDDEKAYIIDNPFYRDCIL